MELKEVARVCVLPAEKTFALDVSAPTAVNDLKGSYFQQLPIIDIMLLSEVHSASHCLVASLPQ